MVEMKTSGCPGRPGRKDCPACGESNEHNPEFEPLNGRYAYDCTCGEQYYRREDEGEDTWSCGQNI